MPDTIGWLVLCGNGQLTIKFGKMGIRQAKVGPAPSIDDIIKVRLCRLRGAGILYLKKSLMSSCRFPPVWRSFPRT